MELCGALRDEERRPVSTATSQGASLSPLAMEDRLAAGVRGGRNGPAGRSEEMRRFVGYDPGGQSDAAVPAADAKELRP